MSISVIEILLEIDKERTWLFQWTLFYSQILVIDTLLHPLQIVTVNSGSCLAVTFGTIQKICHA